MVQYVCSTCSKIFKIKGHWLAHEDTHLPPEHQRFECPVCPTYGAIKAQIYDHWMKAHILEEGNQDLTRKQVYQMIKDNKPERQSVHCREDAKVCGYCLSTDYKEGRRWEGLRICMRCKNKKTAHLRKRYRAKKLLAKRKDLVAAVVAQQTQEQQQKQQNVGSNETDADNQQMNCMVCEDRANGFRYGIITCESCSCFFRRSVQNKRVYTCIADGQCLIIKQLRKLCQYCHFQKCLRQGMLLASVREDRSRGGRHSIANFSMKSSTATNTPGHKSKAEAAAATAGGDRPVRAAAKAAKAAITSQAHSSEN